MTYQGDAVLERLLAKAGSALTGDEVRAWLRGLAAAGMHHGDPDAGIAATIVPGASPALAAQIDALAAEISAASDDGLGPSPAPPDRLDRLRARLAADGLDGFVVPMADEHQNEFVPRRALRLGWLTGFAGSAATVVVLADRAAIFIDGRYTLQVTRQVDTNRFVPHHVTEEPPWTWIAANAAAGATIGYDPWLHTTDSIARLEDACRRAGATLRPVAKNPIDAVWVGQPARPLAAVDVHDERFAGRSSEDKRRETAAGLARDKLAAVALSAPDSIAWLLNIRGGDVANTPLALAFALLRADATVDLFIDARKLSDRVRAHLGDAVAIRAPDALGAALDHLGADGARVQIDPATTPAWIVHRLQHAGATLAQDADPCILPRACKNAVEIEGARAAHRRDGAALARFLSWLDRTAPAGALSETDVADALLAFRRDGEHFRGTSFDTIAGAGPNGAIVHYRATPESARRLEPGSVFLIDSGAQYRDGTTDVTRTVLIEGPMDPAHRAEARDRFTRVLKGHIAVATARFPAGTTGHQLDTLARIALWSAGLDYDHGTGHGVGSYLGVHEGPQRIGKQGSTVALRPGMIVSNEPGYYKTGAYGIRIENLEVVTALPRPEGGERDLLGFTALTLASIDRQLIEPALLDADERAWLDGYHARVRETIAPLVDPETRAWLVAACAPIGAA
ncbi:MAG: aminopeptidase P family protein [Alphaproteobacteria bacterium]|nr:aminopeptidase P family protein [Alphaproteobacteria bacterium]